ncbi:hypothetical protein vseg_005446 [Gypsophila vaccaria]
MGQVISYIRRCFGFDTNTTTLKNDQRSHYVTIPNTETEHVSSSTPKNATDLITPDVPYVVVDLGNDAGREDENCVEHCIEDYVKGNGDKSIQVVENKITDHAKQETNKVKDELKATCVKRIYLS